MLTIDGQFGARWYAGQQHITITFAQPELISRVVFSSDRKRGLGDDYPLTSFVGDYVIEISQDGQQWTKIADSSDRVPPTEIRKKARLLKIVTTDEEIARRALLQGTLAQIDTQNCGRAGAARLVGGKSSARTQGRFMSSSAAARNNQATSSHRPVWRVFAKTPSAVPA